MDGSLGPTSGHNWILSNYTIKRFTDFLVSFFDIRLGQVRLGQIRLGQVRLGQVRLGQVRLGQCGRYSKNVHTYLWRQNFQPYRIIIIIIIIHNELGLERQFRQTPLRCRTAGLYAGLLAIRQYSEGPTTSHLDAGFSWFPCVYKQMLRWFPRFQVATTCFSCNPPDLNSVITNFMLVYM